MAILASFLLAKSPTFMEKCILYYSKSDLTMFNRDKPLFSRPTLAIIIVVTTLAIWLLNLTAPKANLAIPKVSTWQTSSGIPVTWVNQESWKGSDKLTLAFVFVADAESPVLTKAVMDLLTGPSLPLSTATVNQRLTPVAAKASSSYAPHQQQLTVTLSNRTEYLDATLDTLNTWLNQTQFKEVALQQWLRLYQDDIGQQQLLLQLWSKPLTSTALLSSLTVDDLGKRFNDLKQQVAHITVSGDLNEAAGKQLQAGLDRLTQAMKPTAHSSKTWPLSMTPSKSVLGDRHLSAVYGAIGVQPLKSVSDWLALQIWAKDSLEAQKARFSSQVGMWQLNLTRQQPYVTWKVQTPSNVLTSANDATPQPSTASSSWIPIETLPSIKDSSEFNKLKQQLVVQLETLSQNPDWWTAIGVSTTQPDGSLTLEQFAKDYSEAVNSFTIEVYRQHLEQLLMLSSRQEVLIKL